jgi:hypothetical protein
LIGKEAVVRHHAEVPFRLLEKWTSPVRRGGDTETLIVQGDNLVAQARCARGGGAAYFEMKEDVIREML